MFLGILGGTAEHWAQYGTAYRQAWAEVGHPAETADIAVAVHGFNSIEMLGTEVLPQICKELT
jgi:hypothetical protein